MKGENKKGQRELPWLVTVFRLRSVQILMRSPSLGQIQYMPPGTWRYLTTLVATMPVPQLGQGFSKLAPLSPMLARAVFESFSAISSSSFHYQCRSTKDQIIRAFVPLSTIFIFDPRKIHPEFVLRIQYTIS
jgi:hypothetical protein